ncbi:hypothetical protein BVRB_7g167890 [Beta vulgaris subsp. vulgaris]|nr:hypothetical protein BVRB_7g167890 [Beta vulgaris subsp. vulgaris]
MALYLVCGEVSLSGIHLVVQVILRPRVMLGMQSPSRILKTLLKFSWGSCGSFLVLSLKPSMLVLRAELIIWLVNKASRNGNWIRWSGIIRALIFSHVRPHSVEYSLNAIDFARRNATLGAYDDSAVLSRQARSLAENAFFHPSIIFMTTISHIIEPKTFKDAVQHCDWVASMNVELEALELNDTWEVVDLPAGKKP